MNCFLNSLINKMGLEIIVQIGCFKKVKNVIYFKPKEYFKYSWLMFFLTIAFNTIEKNKNWFEQASFCTSHKKKQHVNLPKVFYSLNYTLFITWFQDTKETITLWKIGQISSFSKLPFESVSGVILGHKHVLITQNYNVHLYLVQKSLKI